MLKWPGYPSTRREFEGYQSFRTHDLEILLHLSEIEDKITINYYWSRCDANGNNCDYQHTGRTHNLDTEDVGHVMKVLMSVETDHGVTTLWLQSEVIS